MTIATSAHLVAATQKCAKNQSMGKGFMSHATKLTCGNVFLGGLIEWNGVEDAPSLHVLRVLM